MEAVAPGKSGPGPPASRIGQAMGKSNLPSPSGNIPSRYATRLSPSRRNVSNRCIRLEDASRLRAGCSPRHVATSTIGSL